MTTDNHSRQEREEQEAFRLVIERHRNAASENDVRAAVQHFVATSGIAAWADMTTEEPAGPGHAGRMDLYVHNTCIEFKRDILRNGALNPQHVAQLVAYIEALLKEGHGVRNGILTDGVHYYLHRVGRENPLTTRVFDRPEQAHLLREYLHGILAAPAQNVRPTADNLERLCGRGSDVFRASHQLLKEAYVQHRTAPTVAVKRRLWQDLLQVALGKDAADAGDESDGLFLRHTYITSLVALIMQQQLLGDVVRHAAERPDALLKGRILAEQSDLHGVSDADLFTWPTEVGAHAYLREIAGVVAQFDWTQSPQEVAPTLYQNVIAPEERKKLGEYYTPRWLAQEILAAVVDRPLEQRVLDPACGSGTFIETAVERILAHAGGLSQAETLRKLQDNVVGMDIHPVAVQLAKATWVMAAAETIRAARAEGATAAVSAPIYLGDSLQLRYNTLGTLYASDTIELETGEKLPGQSERVVFRIPKELARQQADIDRLVSEMATTIDAGYDAAPVADKYPLSDECRRMMWTVAGLMRKLHAADRNHVWAYYIRNMIRPAIIAEEKVDRIVGNPPWLTYHQSAGIIRAELRDMSRRRYRIWVGGTQAPHQDIATLFYTRCAELYAKLQPPAVIGMVMPHSALRTGQHRKWRQGHYRSPDATLGLDFRVKAPWDLDNVVPAFFPMPASVVFARYVGSGEGSALAPGAVHVWRGNWQDDYDGIQRQSQALHHDDGKYKSPYADRSRQGATIVDRRLFFVDAVPPAAPILLPATRLTHVKPRQGPQDRVRYEGQLHQLEDVVDNDHLFDVYLGECIAPYVALAPLKAALPVHRATMTMPLNHDDCAETASGQVKHNACRLDTEALHPAMRRRWDIAAQMYREAHANQEAQDLYRNLNYLHKLTRQLEYLQGAIAGHEAVRVAYTASGAPTAAIIDDPHALIDYTLFWIACRDTQEAHYLLALINSAALYEAVKPLMPQGQFGARHVQKHLWKLPIPLYDAGDALHVRLSELGQAAAQECQVLVATSDKPAGTQSRTARQLLRHQWPPGSKVAQAIETDVASLLSDLNSQQG